MKLYVPEIGDRLKLTKDWKFKLYQERRNIKMFEHFGLPFKYEYPVKKYAEITLPKGTVLQVDRIYIRKGAVEYSSISFWAEGIGKGKRGTRFWAKIDDCNQIEFDTESLKDRAKIGLWWTRVPNVKRKETKWVYSKPYKSLTFKKSSKGFITENGYWNESDALYEVEVNYTEMRELKETHRSKRGGMFGVPVTWSKDYTYFIERPDLEYIVKDKDGNLIGTYTSYSGMQKAVREHYNKS